MTEQEEKIWDRQREDMHYRYDYDFHELESIPTITEEDDHFILFPEDVRCWSLAALLGALPDYTLKSNEFYGKVALWCQGVSVEYDNPIDACYELILKLHELNLL